MKNYFYQSPVSSKSFSIVLRRIFATFFLLLYASLANAQYSTVSCSGFNEDVIAEGVGAGFTAIGTTTNNLSGDNKVLMANGFAPSYCTGTYTQYLPVSSTFTSPYITGLEFTIQNFAINNDLRLASPNASGTLVFDVPVQASNLYLLTTSGSGISNISVVVNFTDLTSATAVNLSVPDWYQASPPASFSVVQQVGRVTRDASSCPETNSGSPIGPNLYQMTVPINAANWSKLIASITITGLNTATLGPIANVMAVSAQAPCDAPSLQPTALIQGATTTSSIAASFTNAAVIPSGYLVVRYSSGATPSNPVNGTTYGAGNTLGTGPNTGTVVQSGSAVSFNATGLFGNSSYDFYIYSYNIATSCGGPNYLATAPLKNTVAFTTSACGNLSGIVPVGPTVSPIYPTPGGGFLTLTAALAYINVNGLGGHTVLELQPDYVSTNETFPITFPANPCVGPSQTLTVRPSSSVGSNLLITASNVTATIDFNGAQYVTIDGRPGGTGSATRLFIVNSSITAISTIRFINEASNNLVTYCDVQGASATVANPTTNGVVYFGSTTGSFGNDNNTISFCDIHSAGATLPAIGIGAWNNKANGTVSDNDNNTITGCNIYDFFIATAASTGIKIDAGNNGFTITNNRLFQTNARAYTGAFSLRFLWLNPNSAGANITYASGHTVTGNYLGGSSPAGTGNTTITGTSTSTFLGMDISVGNGPGTTVSGNTLGNINFSSANAATSGTGIFSGISVNYGNVNNISNNIVGSVAAPIVTNSSGASTGVLTAGIRIGGGILAQSISGNQVGSITATASTAIVAPTVVGILFNGGTSSPSVTNNNIGPLTVGSAVTTATGTAQVIGIMTSVVNLTPSFTGNTIHDFRNFASNSNTGATGNNMMGIVINNTSLTSPVSISNNTIYNLSAAAVSTNLLFAPSIQGIFLNAATGSTLTVNGNFIHSFMVPSWSVAAATTTAIPLLIGINTVTGSTATISNNMIRFGIDDNGNPITQPISFRGIYRQATTGTFNIWHNSVYIGGTGVTATSAAVTSAAFYRGGSGTADDIRNNIFANVRTNALAGSKNHAIFLGALTNLTLNNNVYQYVGSVAQGNYFALSVSTDILNYSTFAPVVPGDINSFAGDPNFVNPTGKASVAPLLDLHLSNALPATPAEGLGASLPAIIADFDGETRAGLTPVDIGADAGNFIAIAACTTPASAPTVTLTTVSVSQINGTFTNVGADAYLVVQYLSSASPVVAPVNGTRYDVGNSLGAGTVLANVLGAGPYSFSSTGLLSATSYTYYVYAYNTVSCANGPVYSAAVPQSASTNACAPVPLLIQIGPGLLNNPVSGFTSLTNALNYLNTNGLPNATILEFQSTYSPAVETYPITIGTIPCSNPVNTLTIRPSAGVSAPLLFTSTSLDATILFNGGSNVFLDGRPAGTGINKFIVVENTSTANAAAGNAILMRNEASNNTITYCDIRSANQNVPSSAVATASGSIPGALAIGTTSGASGNDNNLISFCNIHSLTAGGNLGTCVYSGNGTAAGSPANNDNNTIDNCNIYDFFLGASNSSGVNVSLGNNNWTITNNHVYLQNSATYTSSQTIRGFWITPNTSSLTSASGFTISGNYIGGNNANGSNNLTTSGTTSYIFKGMDILVGLGAVTTIQNNTITNWNLTAAFSGNSVYGIDVNNGNVNITGNLVGSTSTNGAITVTSSLTGGSMIALRCSSATTTTGTFNFSGNTVSGINMTGNAVGIATGFNGIACSGGTGITVDNNIIGSATLANSINMTQASTVTTAVAVRGIICNSNATVVPVNAITNNLIANINSNNVATGTQTTTLLGISVTSGTSSIIGNTIRNLTSSGLTTAGGATQAVLGIAYTSTGTSTLISNNTIHTLKLTNAANTVATQVGGIFFSGPSSGSHTIERNFIHSLSIAATTNSTGTITGMDLGTVSAVTINVINNMIRLGLTETGANIVSPCTIRGITKNVPNSNIWFNSIYIGGTGVGTTATNTFAIARTANATDDWRNNVFVNNRNNTTTGGKHYQINLNGSTNLTLNYNNYFGSGTGTLFGFNGTTDAAAYSFGWVAGDANSRNVNPSFIAPNGTSATVNLHINPSPAPTPVESAGIDIPAVTLDIDGDLRSSFSPTDIGADAGNFTTLPACVTPSSPVLAPLTPVSLSQINGSFTNVGSDAYLVVQYLSPASPVVPPSNGLNYSTGSTLGGGTVIAVIPAAGPYSFSATGLATQTAYTYYIYAYNAQCTGGPLYSAAVPQTASTLACSFPGGTVQIGTGAPASPVGFTNLTAALNFINSTGLTAPTTLELRTDYVPSSETYPVTFANIQCNSAINTLTVRPSASVVSQILMTSANTTATVVFNGAMNVIIDGRPGGTGSTSLLSIQNTQGSAPAMLLANESSRNTIKYCSLLSNNSNINTSATAGVLLIGGTTGPLGNDNNLFDFCDIRNVAGGNPVVAVNALGNTTTVSQNNDLNTISNCNIFDYFHATNAYSGINIQAGNNAWSILNNHFYQTTARTVTGTGFNRDIYINNPTGNTTGSGFVITGNSIGGSSANGAGTYNLSGTTAHQYASVYCAVGVGTATSIQNNTLANIAFSSSLASAAAMSGIFVNGGNVDIGTVSGNLIGVANVDASASPSITFSSSSTTSGGFIPIFANNANNSALSTTNVSNNIIAGIRISSTALTSSPDFNAIGYNNGTISITNNIIGSLTTPKSIYCSSTSSTSQTNTSRFAGILISGSAVSSQNITITGNTIANMYTLYANPGAPATTGTVGIFVLGTLTGNTNTTISNNTIRDLTTFSQSTTGGAFPAAGGISVNAASIGVCNITGNSIYNLNLAGAATTGLVQATGIYAGSTTTNPSTIARNFIHSFSIAANNPSALHTGMDIAGGTWNIVNNMIRLGIDGNGASVTVPLTVRGITKNAAASNIWFNSIYIGGTGVGSAVTNTFALARTAGAADDWRNNILVNSRSNAAGGGLHYAVFLSSNSTLALNNNIYFGTGTGYTFGFNGTSNIPSYSAGWVSGDMNSYAEDPSFLNPSGNSTAVNLHINPAVPTRVEQFGTNISSVVVDFDNQDRSLFTPDDIGADAGDFTVLFSCGGSPFAATAELTDNSQICGSGSRTIILSGITATPGLTYQWKESTTGLPGTFQKITSNGTGSSYTTPTIFQTMYYYCEVTCTASEITTPSTIVAVVINQPPVLVVTPPTGTNVCSGSTVTLTATGASTYSWTGSNAAGIPRADFFTTDPNLASVSTVPVSTIGTATPSTVSTPTWTYNLSATNAAGCTATATVVLNVITSPAVPQTLTYAQSPSATCDPGVPVTLTVTNGGTIGSGQWTYKWYDQTGTNLLQTFTGSTSTNSYTPPTPSANGLYSYIATVTNSLCPYSYASADASFFVGYISRKTATNANCGENGMITVYPEGQNNFTTWYSNNFATGLQNSPALDQAYGNATFTSGRCQITASAASQQGGTFMVRNPAGINSNNLQVDYKLTTSPRAYSAAWGADGIAWSYGPNVYQGVPSSGNSGFLPENGTGTGIKLALDAVNNGAINVPGAYLMFNCPVPHQGPNSDGVIAFKRGTFWKGLVDAPVSIVITEDGFITVSINNDIIFDHIPLPVGYLTANKSTWNHAFTARTGAGYELHAIDDLNIRYNSKTTGFEYSTNSTTGSDGTWQISNVFSGLTAGSYPVWVRNPANPSCASNTGMVNIASVASPSSASTVTVSGDNSILCQGSTIALTMDVFVPGATILWENAPSASGPWTPAAGINNALIYTTAPLADDTWFRCNYTCPSSSQVTASPLFVDVNVGSIASTNSPYYVNCTGKPIVLNVTPNAFTTLVWYAGPTGGSPLATGNSYTATPSVLPTTYYVEPSTTLYSNHYFHGGQLVISNAFGTATGFSQNIPVRFTTSANVIIDSIKVFPSQAGILTVALQPNQVGTNLQTFSMPISASQLNTAVNVPVNFQIIGGGSYQLNTTGVNCNYYNGYTGPYSSAGVSFMIMGGGILNVTGSATTVTAASSAGTYGTVFDFNISSACASGAGARVPVVVALDPNAAVNIDFASGSGAVCQGGILGLSASSSLAYSGFVWSPITNLFTDAGATVPYTGGNSANVYARSLTAGPVVYTATGNGSPDGCSNSKSATATVTLAPAVNITPSLSSICPGGTTLLTASSSNPDYSYSWSPVSSFNPSVSVSPSVHSLYTVNAQDNTNGINKGCVTTSTIPIAVNKVGVTASANPVGICSGDNTQLFSTASTTLNYAMNQVTPSPVSVPAGGVTVLNNTVGLTAGNYNDGYWNVNLPFNISYFGDLFNVVSINTNGFITFGSPSTESNAGTIPNLATPNNAIYLAAKNWTMAAGGSIRYFTVGAAPTRRFVIDYLDIPSVSPAGILKGQIILSEADGLIELTLSSTDASSPKTLGIENANGTIAYSPTGRNGSSWEVNSTESWQFAPIGGNFTYAWTPSSNLDDPTIPNPFASGIFFSTTFNVTVSDAESDCSNSASASVTAGDVLAAVVTADKTSICLGDNATLLATPTGGCSPYTYKWEDDFGIVSSFSFANVSPVTTTTYNLTITDNILNEFTYAITITVNPIPNVTATQGLICGTGTATLTASGASTYAWSPSTSLNTTTGASVISSSTVTRTYTVTGTTAAGCTKTATSLVTVANAVSVAASASPVQINTGHSSQLNAFAVSQITGYAVAPTTYANRDLTAVSNAGPTGDEGNVTAALGFNFNFFGTIFTSVTIHTNGQILLGGGRTDADGQYWPATSHTNIPATAAPNNWVGFWADLSPTAGQITWGVVGSAPARKLIARWTNATWFTAGPSPLTYQIELNESTNIIDVFLGTVDGGTIATNHSRLVALENATGTIGYAPSGRTPAAGFWNASNEAWRFSPTGGSGITYSWSPVSFLSSTTIANPVAQNMTSTTTYTVTATNESGCTASANTTVTVGLPFVATASTSANNFCQGGSTTLTATATGGGIPYTSYSWSDGTSIVGTGSTLSLVPPVGTTTYTVTVTDVDNFTTTASVAVTVKPNPTVVLTKSGDICGTGSATLTASGTSSGYTWTPNPTLTVSSLGNVATASPANNTTYTVTGILNGCNTVTSTSVNVFPAIIISAAASPASICFNGTSQLNATPTAGLDFSWSPVDFLSSSIISNPVASGVTASTVYTVTAMNQSTGCTGTATVSLQAGTPVSVTASSSVPSICQGVSASLSSVVTGGGLPYSYSWKAGASEVGTTPNISVTPTTTTTYTLFVTDACSSETQSNTVTVLVNPLPPLTVNPVNSFLCTGVATSTLLTASGADSYSWTPSAGISATTGATVTATPALSTVYTVTGTDALTGCTNTASATVNVSALSATAQAYPYYACHGGNTQLAAFAANTASNYSLNSIPYATVPVSGATTITSWSNTDVDDGSNGPVALPFTFNFYGVNYNQIYVGTNGYISFSDLSTISGINSRKAANINTPTAANNIIALCYADLHAGNGSGSVKYFVSGTAPNRVFVVAYDVVFLTNTGRVKGQIQLYENSNIVEVHVQEVNHGTSASPGALGIENASGTQRVVPATRGPVPGTWNVAAVSPEAWRFSPNAGYSFSWSPSTFLDNSNDAAPNVIALTSATTYTVTTTEISSGCQAVDTVKVNDMPLPSASISGSAEICVGASTNLGFAFTGTPPFTYSYSDGSNTFGPYSSSGFTATKSVSPSAASNYTLSSVSDNFCTGTVSGNALITFDSQAPVITCPANVSVNANAGVNFATGVNLGSATATDNCLVSSVTNNGTFAYLVGNTTVTWKATDSNGNTATCAQTVTVIDNQPPTITCPATVTVNADANQCHATNVDIGILFAIDNDGVADITNNELSQYPVGNTTVTWTATDLSGNTSTCAQTVTVIDNQLPVISCPASKTVNPDAGVCYASGVNLGIPVASDNCAFNVTNNAPAQFQAGLTTVVWKVTDASGNTATCSQSITVIDKEKPVLVGCPASFSSCAPISWTPPTATDNCTPAGSITITSNYAPGAYFPTGMTTVVYTATDGSGNTSTCSFVVTKQDSSFITGISLTSNKPFNNICTGDNITLSINGITATSLGYGAQWKWYSGSCGGTPVPASVNQTSITVSPTANTTYLVRAEGACNSTACVSLQVVVTTAPPSGNPAIIYYPAIAFAGATDSIIVSAVPGATFYYWTTSGNSNILFNGQPAPYESSTPKVTLTFISPATSGNGIGNYHIQYFAGNGCGKTNSNNIRIRATVDAPQTINGPAVVCEGQTRSYTASPVIGAKSYQWAFTSGSGTITGNGTQTVNVTFTTLPATLCVHGVSAFGTSGPDQCVTITDSLATPGPIAGSATPCRGGSETYSIPNVDGATSYIWSTTVGGAVITGGGTSVTVNYPAGLFSGNLCVKALSACDTSELACLNIVSGTVPPVGPITGITEGLCGTSADFEVPSTGATNYAWSVPFGANVTSGSGTNAVSVSFNSSFAGGNITVISTNQCGVSYDTLEVTGSPSTPVISGPSSVCGGDVESYVAFAIGATGFTWIVDSLEGDILLNTNANEILLEWITNGGTISVLAYNSCGSSMATLTVSSNCRIAGNNAMMESLHALVFPNPSQGRVTLQYNSPEPTNYLLKVTDLTGRVLQHESLSALQGLNQHQINLGDVAKGIYMLSLENALGDNIVIRLVID